LKGPTGVDINLAIISGSDVRIREAEIKSLMAGMGAEQTRLQHALLVGSPST
jgi:hypothetical protein